MQTRHRGLDPNPSRLRSIARTRNIRILKYNDRVMDEPTKIRSAAVCAALGHPTRISIVEVLGDRKMSVSDISSALGLAQSSASQHLAALYRSGVLQVTPKGTSRLYHVRGPRIAKALAQIEEFCQVQGLQGVPDDE